MATTTQFVPMDTYLHSSYEPDAEYVDGEIELRAVGEYDHSCWQGAILRWFWLHEKQWNIRAKSELRVQISASRFRVPDVTILDRSLPIEQVITCAPVAVFEVVSPEDTLQRLKRKLEDYRLMGISEIWVIDPKDNTCSRYDGEQLIRTEQFVMPQRGIVFNMSNLTEFLD